MTTNNSDSLCWRQGHFISIAFTVRQLPPRLSFRIRVSLLSRNGTCADPFLLSAKALMQLPSDSSDRLILAPSRMRSVLLVVAEARSDPAKSINDILAVRTSALRPEARLRILTQIQNTACEREDVALASVACWERLPLPVERRHNKSLAVCGLWKDRSLTHTPKQHSVSISCLCIVITIKRMGSLGRSME